MTEANTIHKQLVTVRQMAGKLPNEWKQVYMVLRDHTLDYYIEKQDVKTGAPTESLPLSEVQTSSKKNKHKETTPGFIFEIKTNETRIQHLLLKEEHRRLWLTHIQHTKDMLDVKGEKSGSSEQGTNALQASRKKDRQEFVRINQRLFMQANQQISAMSAKDRTSWETSTRQQDFQSERDAIIDKATQDKTLILDILHEREVKALKAKHAEALKNLQAGAKKEKSSINC